MLIKGLKVLALVATVVGGIYAVLQFHFGQNSDAARVGNDAASRPALADHSPEATTTNAVIVAQSGNCNANISGGSVGTLNLNCSSNSHTTSAPVAPAGAMGGRWRGNQFIPNCPAGQGYSLDEQRCMSRQYIGGVIPCSQDDNVVCR